MKGALKIIRVIKSVAEVINIPVHLLPKKLALASFGIRKSNISSGYYIQTLNRIRRNGAISGERYIMSE
jgi:hypothetical protein